MVVGSLVGCLVGRENERVGWGGRASRFIGRKAEIGDAAKAEENEILQG